MPQGKGDTNVRHRRVLYFARDPLRRRRRRKKLRGRHRRLPTHKQWGMGNLHFDRGVQVMRGVRLRQVPTVLSERRENRHREQKQNEGRSLQGAAPLRRRISIACGQANRLHRRRRKRRFPQNMHNASIVRCHAPGKQLLFRVSRSFGLSR